MRASKLFLLSSLVLLPFQLNKFFWLKSSYVLGIPIDYLAASVYLSDVAVFGTIIFGFLQSRKTLLALIHKNLLYTIALFAFNLIFLLQAIFISNSPSGYFYFLKLLEFSLFTMSAAVIIPNMRSETLKKALLISLVPSALILLFEFAAQRSLGLFFLGERAFDTTTPAIAHISLGHVQFLRPYGTFPHPNVAGAYFVFAFIIFSGLAGEAKLKATWKQLLAIIGATITFSKTAAALIFLTVALFFSGLFNFFLALFALGSISALITYASPDFQFATISERLLLIKGSLTLTSNHFLFGVGPANFIPKLAQLNLISISEVRLLQPVHNILLLTLAENGFLGFLFFTLTFIALAPKIDNKFKLSLLIFLLVFGSLDHFFLTLQQGRILFALTSAFILAEQKKAKN